MIETASTASGRGDLLVRVTAILAALGIYVCLFVGFDWRAPAVGGEVRRRRPKVILLPLHTPPVNRMHAELQEWARLREPTIMSLPNARHGFSRVRTYEFARPVRAPAAVRMNVETVVPPVVPPRVLSREQARLQHIVAAVRRRDVPAPAPTAAQLPTPGSGPTWTDPDGVPLGWLPRVAADAAGASGHTVRGAALYGVSQRHGLKRVRLLRSCGDAALDGRGADALMRAFNRHDGVLDGAVLRQLSAGRPFFVLLNWRYAPGVTEETPDATAPFGRRGGWYDTDWF